MILVHKGSFESKQRKDVDCYHFIGARKYEIIYSFQWYFASCKSHSYHYTLSHIAQWQSTFFDLLCLNQLLLEPLPPIRVSEVLECSNIVWLFRKLQTSREEAVIEEMGLNEDMQ